MLSRPHRKSTTAMFLGFENDLSLHILGIDMDCDPARRGGWSTRPSLLYIWGEPSTRQK